MSGSEQDTVEAAQDFLPERDLACKAEDAVGFLHIGVDPDCDPVGGYWIPVDDREYVEREHVPCGDIVQYPVEDREPERRDSRDVPDHVQNWSYTGDDDE